MPDPKRLYRWLLKLYPARFHEEYESPLERQFLDEYQETQGRWARVRFWMRALKDLAISIPRETLRELRRISRTPHESIGAAPCPRCWQWWRWHWRSAPPLASSAW
jgi:hypothetical protein